MTTQLPKTVQTQVIESSNPSEDGHSHSIASLDAHTLCVRLSRRCRSTFAVTCSKLTAEAGAPDSTNYYDCYDPDPILLNVNDTSTPEYLR